MTYSASEGRHAAGTEGINWPLRQREADGSRNCWDGSLILEKMGKSERFPTTQNNLTLRNSRNAGERRGIREKADGMSVSP